MAKEQIAKSEPQKAPCVKPKILRTKVDLSFAGLPKNLRLKVRLGCSHDLQKL
jgi:hypothetical protein